MDAGAIYHDASPGVDEIQRGFGSASLRECLGRITQQLFLRESLGRITQPATSSATLRSGVGLGDSMSSHRTNPPQKFTTFSCWFWTLSKNCHPHPCSRRFSSPWFISQRKNNLRVSGEPNAVNMDADAHANAAPTATQQKHFWQVSDKATFCFSGLWVSIHISTNIREHSNKHPRGYPLNIP